jgi:hypothetical protein
MPLWKWLLKATAQRGSGTAWYVWFSLNTNTTTFGTAWWLLGTVFKNIYSVSSIFIASVTVDVLEKRQKTLPGACALFPLLSACLLPLRQQITSNVVNTTRSQSIFYLFLEHGRCGQYSGGFRLSMWSSRRARWHDKRTTLLLGWKLKYTALFNALQWHT